MKKINTLKLFRKGDAQTENPQTGGVVFSGTKGTGADCVETRAGQVLDSLVQFDRFESLMEEDGDKNTRRAKPSLDSFQAVSGHRFTNAT